MDLLLSPYPTARFWCAGLFLAVALVMGLLLLSRKRQRGEGSGPLLVLGTFAFFVWELCVLLALIAHARTEGADLFRGILLGLVLFTIPVGLTFTLLVTGDGRLACAACTLVGLGVLVVPGGSLGDWLVTAALLGLIGLMLALLLNAFWSNLLGYSAGGLALLAIGGLTAVPAGEMLSGGCRTVASAFVGGQIAIADGQAWWLLLLLLVPLIFLFSFRSLAGLGPVRRWVAIGLRCLLIVLLTLALAEVHLRHSDETVTVLLVWDRSLSIPGEFEGGDHGPDLRKQRILKFINDAIRCQESLIADVDATKSKCAIRRQDACDLWRVPHDAIRIPSKRCPDALPGNDRSRPAHASGLRSGPRSRRQGAGRILRVC